MKWYLLLKWNKNRETKICFSKISFGKYYQILKPVLYIFPILNVTIIVYGILRHLLNFIEYFMLYM